MALEWGWSNGNQNAVGVDTSTAFNNPNTGRVEAATSQGGVGNPYSDTATANYADPHWSAENQYKYSQLMSQGRNQEAAALGAQAWQQYDTDRAHAQAVRTSNSFRGQPGGGSNPQYIGARIGPDGTWSVYDPTNKTWKSGIATADLKATLGDEEYNKNPDWYYTQQEEEAERQADRLTDYDVMQQQKFGTMGTTNYRYAPTAF